MEFCIWTSSSIFCYPMPDRGVSLLSEQSCDVTTHFFLCHDRTLPYPDKSSGT